MIPIQNYPLFYFRCIKFNIVNIKINNVKFFVDFVKVLTIFIPVIPRVVDLIAYTYALLR